MPRHRVVALVLDTVVPFDLGVPCQVFGWGRPDLGEIRYDYVTCAVRPGPVETGRGFELLIPRGLEALRAADTVVVPGISDLDRPIPRAACDALCTAHARGARILSICSGAFVLAEAGLLDGRRATTHWQDAELLARRYPAVIVEPKALYIDERTVLTSAGISAGIDLCVHVVRRDFGAAVANAVSRRLVAPPHRTGGQAQYIETPVAEPLRGGLERTREWALENIRQTLTIHTMAMHARMSDRSFARRFVQEAGISPLKWLVRQRLLVAQQLLESTSLSIKQIAARAGWGSAASFRQHFGRGLGTSPAAYRLAFRGPVQPTARPDAAATVSRPMPRTARPAGTPVHSSPRATSRGYR